jgi:TetR/AcrR family transcriptional regulator, cholesterol catabolism regulator
MAMNKRSFGLTKVSGLLRAGARKGNVLVRDREILRQKRAELADVAFDLFLDRGFHRTGVREIAAAAGLSVGAVFTYFTDKEEILAHIFFGQLERVEDELLGTLRLLIGERTSAGADPEAVFDGVFTQFLRTVDALRRFILLAYQETKSLNAAARNALIAREKRVQGLLGEAISYGAERGRFDPDNIELKAHNIMVLGHAWAIRHWMFAGVMNSVEEYAEFLLPLVYSMLETCAPSGLPKRDRPGAKGSERGVLATK